ncbi:MAG: glutamate-5-semialdehyde dehydrogenase [Victivallales bacterium]|nr:glutamate-5-semialdehyde dehydrogenase [Victivallales bacterium]
MATRDLAQLAKQASIPLSDCSLDARNHALMAMADALAVHADEIRAANERDLDAARQNGLDTPLLKRLVFDDAKRASVIDGLRSLAALPDPLGRVLTHTELADGLELTRVSCPIGVIGIIFEARPDAVVQISSLCLKSGNAVLLKGGSEALHTNRALATVIAEATATCGVPEHWIQLLETRTEVTEMLALNEYIDLIVPRGSNAFVKYIMEHTTIPVLGHSSGLCHLYIDSAANAEMACRIAVDAKTQAPATCNTIETLLIHQDAATALLPQLAGALRAAKVELRGDERSRAIVPDLLPATVEDWSTEYLDYILSIKVVDDISEAIDHINRFGSHHTDAIVTDDENAARLFQRRVDSADVFWNASTRFADGFRFGLGAEVGISTSKIHSRGPVGLEGLTIYKWLLDGSGQAVAPFCDGRAKFTHRPL